MKNNVKFILSVLLLIGLYALFLTGFKLYNNTENEAPVISIQDEILTVSVKDKENVLLQGVRATDSEDGDLTSKIVIDSISEFDEKNYRTVTYVVFDNNDQMAKATRRIKYSDYSAPVFEIEKPLIYYYLADNSELTTYMKAISCVDGNISVKILVENDYYYNRKSHVVFSVIDSCGAKSTITLKADELNEVPSIDFILSDYLIRVSKDTEIDPYVYIEHIDYFGMDLTDDVENISIQNNYDPTTPGMYEFIYRYSDDTGEFGITKLVVIVE